MSTACPVGKRSSLFHSRSIRQLAKIITLSECFFSCDAKRVACYELRTHGLTWMRFKAFASLVLLHLCAEDECVT